MPEPKKIQIRRWFDGHLHPRDGELMKTILPCTLAQQATGAVVMGNLIPPDHTDTIAKTASYRERIQHALPQTSDFKLRMTCYLTDDTTPDEIEIGFMHEVWFGAKQYPVDQKGQGGTTHSVNGVRNIPGRFPVYERMQKLKITLLSHTEAAEEEIDEFDREIVGFERDLLPVVKAFPELPIIVEHITDGRVADVVASGFYPNLYATVTAHHPMMNRNAIFRGGLNSVEYCRPVAKREPHRIRIRQHITSGNKRFRAGTDSAAHDVSAKSRPHGCAAGIFTAPVAVELYTTIFEEENALQYLEAFLSENFLHLYRMKPSDELMTIERVPQTIPNKIGNVLVFRGGSEIPWTLVKK